MDERVTDNHKPEHGDVALPPPGSRRFARDTLPLLGAMAVALLVLLYVTTAQAGSPVSGAASHGAVQLAAGSGDRSGEPAPQREAAAADESAPILRMLTPQRDAGLGRLTQGLREVAAELEAVTERWIGWARNAWNERDIAMPTWRTPSADELPDPDGEARAAEDLRTRIEDSWAWLKAAAGDLLQRAGRAQAKATATPKDGLEPRDRRHEATRTQRRDVPVQPLCADCDASRQLSI